MGSISAYNTASGKRYRVRWRTPDRKQTDKRGFLSKRDAQTFLASIEVAMARGEYMDPTAGKITVAEVARDWLHNKEVALKPSSYRSLELAWRVFVGPRWGSTPIQNIRPSAVETWIRELSLGTAKTERERNATPKPLSATVVIRAVGVLAGVLDTAVRDGRITRNPARGAENLPRKVSSKPRRYLSHEEVVRFASATATDVHEALVLLLAYTGLRWGEAIGLRVRDLNMMRRRILVNQSAVDIDGTIHVGPPKNWERRSVPFPAFLALPLAKLCEGKGADDLVFRDNSADGYLRRPASGVGKNSWFLRALSDAGIERLTPHDLRHTAASLAISSGAHVKAVQRMLGHKSAAMTLDTYADLFDDDLDAVAERLEAGAIGANVGKLWATAVSS
ncbi:tyrosine-type recombinase/integrase [Microbacterium tumbae]